MENTITNNLNNSFINIEDTYVEQVYSIYRIDGTYIAYVLTEKQAELEIKFLGTNYYYVLEEKNI